MELTLAQLADRIGATLRGDGQRRVDGCAGLEEAGPTQVSFLANRRYARHLASTRAAAVILSPNDAEHAPEHLPVLVADEPYFAFREATVALHGFRPQPAPGISEQAQIHPTATIGENCHIGPFAYVGERAVIGDNSVLYPHTYVGPDARIGRDCLLYPNVTVYDRCELGDRVTLHAGCVIGQDGFGYATHQGVHHKIPQVGNAVVEDDVEMGAGCAVDRATVGSTRIGKGSKFSDLVAIGHGTRVGEHNLLVAQVGLAGSVTTGNYVVMGGQVGVAGHLKITDMVQVAAKAGIGSDITQPGTYGGAPAGPFDQAKRSMMALAKLPELLHEFRALRRRVKKLEAQLDANDSD